MTDNRPPAPPLDQPYYGIPFLEAQKRLVQKAFVYTGRASPSEYWFGALGIFLAIIAGEIVFALLTSLLTWIGYQTNSYGLMALVTGLLGLCLWILIIALALAQISLAVRRLHDAGDPGTYYLFSLIPFVGGIILLVFVLKAPSPLGQRYDLPPGMTRGYLFIPKSTASVAGQSFGVPSPQGYSATPEYAAPAVPSQGFAPSSGYTAPVVPAPAQAVPPIPMPSSATAAVVPAAPPVPVPPVPEPGALVVPPVPAASAQLVPPVPAAPSVAPANPANAAISMPAGPIQAVPGLAPSVPPVPVPAVASAVAQAAPVDDDDLDATRITAYPTGSWRIVLADGRQIPLGSSARLGRDPGADPSDPSALLIPVDDPAKSISKTHVSVTVVDGGILITDLHSTNGTVVRAADGSQTALAPGAAYRVASDADVRIGEYPIQLRHEGA